MPLPNSRALQGIAWLLVGLCAAALGLEALDGARSAALQQASEGVEHEALAAAAFLVRPSLGGRARATAPAPVERLESTQLSELGLVDPQEPPWVLISSAEHDIRSSSTKLKLLTFGERALFRVAVQTHELTHRPDPKMREAPKLRVLTSGGVLHPELVAVVVLPPVLVNEESVVIQSPGLSGWCYSRDYECSFELLGFDHSDAQTYGVIEANFEGATDRLAFSIEPALEVLILWGGERRKRVAFYLRVKYPLGSPAPRAELTDRAGSSLAGLVELSEVDGLAGTTCYEASWMYASWPPIQPQIRLELTALDGSVFFGTYTPGVEDQGQW